MKKMSFEEVCENCKDTFHISEVKIFDPEFKDDCNPFTNLTTLCLLCYEDSIKDNKKKEP